MANDELTRVPRVHAQVNARESSLGKREKRLSIWSTDFASRFFCLAGLDDSDSSQPLFFFARCNAGLANSDLSLSTTRLYVICGALFRCI